MAQKSTYLKAKTGQKKSSADTQKKAISSKLSLKGNQMAGYILKVQNGDWQGDLQITEDELKQLYYLLERKYGEFLGYKIK